VNKDFQKRDAENASGRSERQPWTI